MICMSTSTEQTSTLLPKDATLVSLGFSLSDLTITLTVPKGRVCKSTVEQMILDLMTVYPGVEIVVRFAEVR